MKLNLGVVEMPYQGSTGMTTGDVATILESRYGIMGMFYLLHGDEIQHEIEEVFKDKVEALQLGRPIDQFPIMLDGVEQSFRHFLDTRQMDGRAPGVPTRASLQGINHRLKRPYARYVYRGARRTRKMRPSRPSFIDTGLYQSSFRAWIDE